VVLTLAAAQATWVEVVPPEMVLHPFLFHPLREVVALQQMILRELQLFLQILKIVLGSRL
jgi:hypothetical protein